MAIEFGFLTEYEKASLMFYGKARVNVQTEKFYMLCNFCAIIYLVRKIRQNGGNFELFKANAAFAFVVFGITGTLGAFVTTESIEIDLAFLLILTFHDFVTFGYIWANVNVKNHAISKLSTFRNVNFERF